MTDNLTTILKQFKIFDSCSDDFIESLSKQAQTLDLPKGKIIFINEDHADHFYFVLSGWVKLFRETLDGAQAIIDILPQNHIFGETSIFQDDIYPYSAEVAEAAKIISLPLSLLKSEIASNPKLAMSMMSSMARYRKQQDQEIENRTLKNAPQRIGCFLLRLIDSNAQGAATIHLPYDKTLVASRLGMQPETFSRALNKLKDHIEMSVKGSTIEIADSKDLIEYACSACSSEFPCHDMAG